MGDATLLAGVEPVVVNDNAEACTLEVLADGGTDAGGAIGLGGGGGDLLSGSLINIWIVLK